MKKRFPLEILIKARQVRVDAALKQVDQARGFLREREAERDRCAERKAAKQDEHSSQRAQLICGATETSASACSAMDLGLQFAQRERHLEMLLEQLEVLDQALLDAQHDVYSAEEALQAAVANYRRMQNKLDTLIERKARWRVEQEIASDNADEVNAEEILLATRLQKTA